MQTKLVTWNNMKLHHSRGKVFQVGSHLLVAWPWLVLNFISLNSSFTYLTNTYVCMYLFIYLLRQRERKRQKDRETAMSWTLPQTLEREKWTRNMETPTLIEHGSWWQLLSTEKRNHGKGWLLGWLCWAGHWNLKNVRGKCAEKVMKTWRGQMDPRFCWTYIIDKTMWPSLFFSSVTCLRNVTLLIEIYNQPTDIYMSWITVPCGIYQLSAQSEWLYE